MNRRNFFTSVVSFVGGLVTGTLFKPTIANALNKEMGSSGERSFNPYDYSEVDNVEVMYTKGDSAAKEFQYCSKEILNRMLVKMARKGYKLSTYYVSPESFEEIKNHKKDFTNRFPSYGEAWQFKIEIVGILPNNIVVAKDEDHPEYLVVGLINRRTIKG
jgi:hypothetical protein